MPLPLPDEPVLEEPLPVPEEPVFVPEPVPVSVAPLLSLLFLRCAFLPVLVRELPLPLPLVPVVPVDDDPLPVVSLPVVPVLPERVRSPLDPGPVPVPYVPGVRLVPVLPDPVVVEPVVPCWALPGPLFRELPVPLPVVPVPGVPLPVALPAVALPDVPLPELPLPLPCANDVPDPANSPDNNTANIVRFMMIPSHVVSHCCEFSQPVGWYQLNEPARLQSTCHPPTTPGCDSRS